MIEKNRLRCLWEPVRVSKVTNLVLQMPIEPNSRGKKSPPPPLISAKAAFLKSGHLHIQTQTDKKARRDRQEEEEEGDVRGTVCEKRNRRSEWEGQLVRHSVPLHI